MLDTVEGRGSASRQQQNIGVAANRLLRVPIRADAHARQGAAQHDVIDASLRRQPVPDGFLPYIRRQQAGISAQKFGKAMAFQGHAALTIFIRGWRIAGQDYVFNRHLSP